MGELLKKFPTPPQNFPTNLKNKFVANKQTGGARHTTRFCYRYFVEVTETLQHKKLQGKTFSQKKFSPAFSYNIILQNHPNTIVRLACR